MKALDGKKDVQTQRHYLNCLSHLRRATEDVGDMPMVDVCVAQPYHVSMLTPELVQRDRFSVESIQYDGNCDEFVVMDFCGQKIKLWKPSGAVSDVTLRDLPAEETFLAMQKEIRGLVGAG